MSFTEDKTEKLDILFTKFGSYCKSKQNITVERYRFDMHVQESSETIDQYVTEFKLIAKNCGYGKLEDQLIRDQIVCGIKSETVKQCLLRTEDLTLDKAISIGRTEEQSQKDAQHLSEEPTSEAVHWLRFRTPEAETRTQPGLSQQTRESKFPLRTTPQVATSVINVD